MSSTILTSCRLFSCFNRSSSKRTLSSVTAHGKKPRVAITETRYSNLHLVTASPDLSDLQSKLESKFKINKLRKLLVELGEDYERIYIDTPPALNFYTVSALIAADRVLIPFDCDDFSRQALYILLENVQEIRADHNPELQVKGIVVRSQNQGWSRGPDLAHQDRFYQAEMLVARRDALGVEILDLQVNRWRNPLKGRAHTGELRIAPRHARVVRHQHQHPCAVSGQRRRCDAPEPCHQP